ncbi:hypothetical protein C922_05183 [Plasmodium inui San Antonio 1]|uniref:Uncharacterized protein n=1 Tax=Plasmodium inui San Antonio 1 TaxID=1237626 RepID=W7A5S4_9APIC|nr:hypothetical protein C922_05183 [Plasmodium inui San Antonio 1]EUD64439.1 hypothetical protein C922_05183 [Plasmodium inui San Antonio 1]
MSDKLCRWRTNVWLGLEGKDLEAFCGHGDEGLPQLEETYLNRTTVWTGWLDEYLRRPESETLGALYRRIKDERVVKGCGGQNESLENTTWQNLILDVLSNMIDINRIESECDQKQESLGAQDHCEVYKWRDLLKRKICPDKPESVKWMGAMTCLIKIWEKGKSGDEDLSKDLPKGCESILELLRVEESAWESTLEASYDSEDGECRKEEHNQRLTGVQKGKISFLLSLYGSLGKLCTTCGPYELNNWIASGRERTSLPRRIYCQNQSGELNCAADLTKLNGKKNYLLYTTGSGPHHTSDRRSSCLINSSPRLETQRNTETVVVLSPQEQNRSHLEFHLVRQTNLNEIINPEAQTPEEGQSSDTKAEGRHMRGTEPTPQKDGHEDFPPPFEETSVRDGEKGGDGDAVGQETLISGKTANPQQGKTRADSVKNLGKPHAAYSNKSKVVIGGIITSIILGTLAVYGAWRIRRKGRNRRHVGPLPQEVMGGYQNYITSSTGKTEQGGRIRRVQGGIHGGFGRKSDEERKSPPRDPGFRWPPKGSSRDDSCWEAEEVL